ncbi:MAG: putative drug exporter of the superfamily [Mycobacterium sp.]|nr:putative drug exporter of the superfamily [Mycobacterium sp.]
MFTPGLTGLVLVEYRRNAHSPQRGTVYTSPKTARTLVSETDLREWHSRTTTGFCVRILGAGHFYLGDAPQLFAILGPSSTRGARMIRPSTNTFRNFQGRHDRLPRMLTRLAMFAVRRPKVVLAAVVGLLGISIVFGGSVSEKLGVSGYTDPASESSRVDDYLEQKFGATSNLVLQVIARDGTVKDPGVLAAGDRVRRLVEDEAAAKVIRSFTNDMAADLRSRDGRSGLILIHVGGTAEEAAATTTRIVDRLRTDDPNVTVRAGGSLGLQEEVRDRVTNDVATGEAIALPITLAVLVLVFGGLIAAFLPLAVGITSIVTTMLVLLLMTKVTDVSVHALTVATAFGLGLSIDFGLLMVSRFREERDNGKDHQSAIIATVTSAGRTIMFSAATVTLAMTGLLVFPIYFLRSVGIAASAVVMLSAFSAIVVLPALLALLGKRIDSLALVRRKVPLSANSVFWRRCAQAVTRRPLRYGLPVVAALLALGIPFLTVRMSTPDERALPTDSNSRLLTQSLREDFAVDPSQGITLLARDNTEALKTLAADVSLMDGVALVDGPIGRYEHGRQISGPRPASAQPQASYAFVYLSVSAQSDTAQDLVRAIRAKIAAGQVEVGGPTAALVDSRAAISDRLGLAILLIAVFTFVLLFLFTGSIVVPIKALVLNLLVLSAVLGVMVLIFQDGHLASLLGITPAPLNLCMVVLLCVMAFTLSVDYEIFLLSRIKEARESGMSNNDAIVVGLGRVGRIISSAAVLLTITLISFANGLSFMMMFGIGTALAVVLDATVIRGVVVPAFLRVAGDLNWWAPAPLKRLHARIGVSEAPSAATPEAAAETPKLPAMPAAADARSQGSHPAEAPRPWLPIAGRPVERFPAAGGRYPALAMHAPAAAPADARPVLRMEPIAMPRRSVVILDDNSRLEIDGDCLIGRAPHEAHHVRRGLRFVKLEDRSGQMSRAHAEIRRIGGEVFIIDPGSTHGVFLRGPGRQSWTRLVPWRLERWFAGGEVRIGGRTLRLHPPTPQTRPGGNPAARLTNTMPTAIPVSASGGPVGDNRAYCNQDREYREQLPGRGHVPAGRQVYHHPSQPRAERDGYQLHGVDRAAAAPPSTGSSTNPIAHPDRCGQTIPTPTPTVKNAIDQTPTTARDASRCCVSVPSARPTVTISGAAVISRAAAHGLGSWPNC